MLHVSWSSVQDAGVHLQGNVRQMRILLQTESAVERMWHIKESQGLGSQARIPEPFQAVPISPGSGTRSPKHLTSNDYFGRAVANSWY